MVLILLGSFLVYVMSPESVRGLIDAYLALGARTIPDRPWSIATALVVERSAWGLLNIIGLWFAGAAVEHALGTRRFLVLFFVSGLASNATVALLAFSSPGLTVSGVGDSVLALIVAMAVLYRNAPLRLWGALALPARTLAIFLVGLSVVLGLGPYTWPLSCGTVAASVAAYFLAGGKGRWLGDFWARWRQKARRSRYQVLDGGRGARRKDYLN
jgi:membrane associated rhomboid family serine protease